MDAVIKKLSSKGLRVTPQRVAVLDTVTRLNNHPGTGQIIAFIQKHHPSIATGTVYRILEILVQAGLIRKVRTGDDIMRYDAVLEKHHHLYSSKSERIDDHYDAKLDTLLDAYFKKNAIPGFTVEDIQLQLTGTFSKNKLKRKP
ncbi:MAG: transcriptional repressor [Bacteroidales bacterium]